MLNFEKLILHNFGSYGHTEINLQNRGFCLVSGQNNYPKDNALSNGSGKSFLWNAICFALVGETINGLKSNLKNINILDDATCYVALEFSENKDKYQITRFITPRSDLKIIKNDIDLSGKGIRESEKKLNELLPDLTKNLITSTIIIGQGMPNKFSSFSPSGRKDLLEKLTKADFMIEDIKQRVANRLATLSSLIRELEDALLATNSQKSVFESTLKASELELNRMVKPDFDSQIKEQEQRLADLAEILKKLQTTNAEGITELTALSESLIAVNNLKAREVEAERLEYETQSFELLQMQVTLNAEVKTLTQQIASLKAITDTCPTCGQKIPGTVKPDTTLQEQQLAKVNFKLTDLTNTLNKLTAEYRQKVAQIAEKYEAQLQETQSKTSKLTASMAHNSTELTTMESQQGICRERLTKLTHEREIWDTQYQSLVDKITELKLTNESLTQKATGFEQQREELLKHLAVVKKMDSLIKRDFRGFLLSNIISYLDKKAKEYCQVVFGTQDLEIALDGNDLNIVYCGKMFDNLSGGEKQRVDLILQFAIRSMLTAYLNFNSNILVLDEITDFLDKKSCAAVLELVTKELNTIESVFIVSHHASELALPIDSELVIEKDAFGISKVVLGI